VPGSQQALLRRLRRMAWTVIATSIPAPRPAAPQASAPAAARPAISGGPPQQASGISSHHNQPTPDRSPPGREASGGRLDSGRDRPAWRADRGDACGDLSFILRPR